MFNLEHRLGQIQALIPTNNIETKDIKSLKSIAIFHPAFLLRSPSYKKLAWEDLLAIQKEIKNYTFFC